MVKSIRVRLLLWYAVVLTTVVAGFAVLLYYEVRSARLSDVDAQLETAAAALDASLRLFPRYELTGEPPPMPQGPMRGDRPGGGGGFGPGFGPPGGRDRDRMPPGDRQPPPGERQPPGERFGPMGILAQRERLLNELVLPRTDNPMEAATSFAVWRADGSLMKTLGVSPNRARPVSRVRSYGQTQNGIRERITHGPLDTMILVGRPIERVESELSALIWQLIFSGAAVLAIGLIGGWILSRQILRPIAAIATTASRISADNLHERIDPATVDRELADLAAVLNGAFDRLEAAFERQARFTADASHELRTPLAVIRSQADLALSRSRTPEEYRQALEACRKSAVRMTDLVEKLLLLARTDALAMPKTPVALERVFADAVEQFRTLAKEKQVKVSAHLSPVTVSGDALGLGQVAANLIANAIQHNHPGGSVRITLERSGSGATLTVTDTGPGIPDDAIPHLFERFYRADKARSRAAGGSGLGLAIAESIVRAHDGVIDVNSRIGHGTTFRVILPVLDDRSVPALSG